MISTPSGMLMVVNGQFLKISGAILVILLGNLISVKEQ
jgi:hypothetical protein